MALTPAGRIEPHCAVAPPGGSSCQAPSCDTTGPTVFRVTTPNAPLAPSAWSNTVARGTPAPPMSMQPSNATVKAEALDVLWLPSYLLPMDARIWNPKVVACAVPAPAFFMLVASPASVLLAPNSVLVSEVTVLKTQLPPERARSGPVGESFCRSPHALVNNAASKNRTPARGPPMGRPPDARGAGGFCERGIISLPRAIFNTRQTYPNTGIHRGITESAANCTV